MKERNGEQVRRILTASGQALALHRREARGVLREVFRIGDDHVAKRYTFPADQVPGRRPWISEDRALSRLAGNGAPAPVGFIEERMGGVMIGTLVRRYLRGAPLGTPDAALAADMGRLIAAIHRHGVTTEDAHRDNFILRDDGRLAFVDFGKARTFGALSPLVFVGIAFDLHRLFRAGLDRDETLWRVFEDAYFAAADYAAPSRLLVRGLLAVERRRYATVRGR